MPNTHFQFKQFIVHHDRCAMKVTTDSCFFGAWASREIQSSAIQIEKVLDIGTGTGLLSLMIAQENKASIDAVEIDADAAGQAEENISSSPWSEKIKVYNQDILNFHPGYKYDCIICNPPFYENELNSNEQRKNIAHHSSSILISQVLNKIKNNLKEDGIFFLMYPAKRQKEVDNLFEKEHHYFIRKIILKQSVNHAGFRIIAMATNKKVNEVGTSEISIWNEKQQYTSEFIDLLKDYYLYL